MGVPILYTPWISFPVGDEPKSGLLFPTIGSSSRTGTQVAVPWYWRIAPNYDATFTPRYMSSRGCASTRSSATYGTQPGTLNAEYLYDDQETATSAAWSTCRTSRTSNRAPGCSSTPPTRAIRITSRLRTRL